MKRTRQTLTRSVRGRKREKEVTNLSLAEAALGIAASSVGDKAGGVVLERNVVLTKKSKAAKKNTRSETDGQGKERELIMRKVLVEHCCNGETKKASRHTTTTTSMNQHTQTQTQTHTHTLVLRATVQGKNTHVKGEVVDLHALNRPLVEHLDLGLLNVGLNGSKLLLVVLNLDVIGELLNLDVSHGWLLVVLFLLSTQGGGGNVGWLADEVVVVVAREDKRHGKGSSRRANLGASASCLENPGKIHTRMRGNVKVTN